MEYMAKKWGKNFKYGKNVENGKDKKLNNALI